MTGIGCHYGCKLMDTAKVLYYFDWLAVNKAVDIGADKGGDIVAVVVDTVVVGVAVGIAAGKVAGKAFETDIAQPLIECSKSDHTQADTTYLCNDLGSMIHLKIHMK